MCVYTKEKEKKGPKGESLEAAGRKTCITCISNEFPDMQFETSLLTTQSKGLVLGISSAAFVVPKVDPQGPLLGLVFGQGVNLLQTEPVVL